MKYHNFCTTCEQDFSSLQLFDSHRVGDFKPGEYFGPVSEWEPKKGRRCLTTDEMLERGWSKNTKGVWHNPEASRKARERFRSKL